MTAEKFQSIETQLNLHFVPVDQEKLLLFREQMNIVSSVLGKETPSVRLPKKGFLAQPLSIEQRKNIDQMLGPLYAKEGVALQDKLVGIPVKESMESMVYIPRLFAENNITISTSDTLFNPACGEWANKPRVYWTRATVAHRLLLAGQSLKEIGLMLHLEDAFRPIGVQEGLFMRRIKLILKEHPDWENDWDRVWIEARSKTAVSPWMAGHKSGAAVDITLQALNGEPLPLGNNYPDGGPRVALFFPYLTQEEWTTRMIFAHTMELSGLRIYPYENWHASFGDLSAGITFGEDIGVTPNYETQYGPIKGFDPLTGEIQPYDPSEYFEPFYSKEELLSEVQENR